MTNSQREQNPVLSVTELNQYARGILEMHVGKIAVMGEISNFSQPASGHWYFTLKDSNAQIRCAMFRNKNQFLRIRPANGMQIIIQGSVSIYEGRGDYQLIADYMEESGVGALQKQFEQLKSQLAAEGLFDSKHKQALPENPRHIGIITSASGAAVHDILTVLNERFPCIKVTIIPTAVQGTGAAREICRAIDLAERWNTENIDAIDAIIVGRGGGSIEDIWPFNEESVARAIFSCKIPVISAVGHEVDITIADFVADVRAPTPSAAAEIISPDQNALRQEMDHYEQQLNNHIEKKLGQIGKHIQLLHKSLKHPGERLQHYKLQFDQLSVRMLNAQQKKSQQSQHAMALLQERFFQQSPATVMGAHEKHVIDLQQELAKKMQLAIREKQLFLAQQAQLLDTVSPLATLNRGYAIIRDKDNAIIRNSKKTGIGDTVNATLANGELTCIITHIN